MSWIIWPAALVLCILCAVGVALETMRDWSESGQHEVAENNRYYPVWLQNCIALADPITVSEDQKERTPDHGRTPQ